MPSPVAVRGPVRRVCTAATTAVVVGGRVDEDAGGAVEGDEPDLDAVGDLVDELRGALDGGLDAAGGDVGRGHRRRHVDGQDDHALVPRDLLGLDRLGQPEDDEGERGGRQDGSDVATPAEAVGGDRGVEVGGGRTAAMARRRRRWTTT